MSSNRIWFELATKALLIAAAFSLAALCLAACASPAANPAKTARNPAELYPLSAGMAPDQIALAIHAPGLSQAQVSALDGLAVRWLTDGSGPIALQVPRAVDADLASRAQADARAVLVAHGVPQASIRLAAYDSADTKAPMLAGFSHYAANIPACGRDWENLTSTRDNNVRVNFGCALTANMAAQIAHPADILGTRPEDAPSADRRETVIGKYAAGELTASKDDPVKSGVVSRVAP